MARASSGAKCEGRRGYIHWTIVSIVMWALALLFLIPFVWMVVSSLKREIDVFRLPIRWVPDPLTWKNYVEIWTGPLPDHRFHRQLAAGDGRPGGW